MGDLETMNWAIFPSGFSANFNHKNYPTETEMKDAFTKQVGAWLKGEYEFTFEASDPQHGKTITIKNRES